MQAFKFLDEKWSPKFTVIVAQRNHHTKFFQTGSPDNVPPGNNYEVCYCLHASWQCPETCNEYMCHSAGTVVDSKVCHPRNFDFYMCAHAGMIVS